MAVERGGTSSEVSKHGIPVGGENTAATRAEDVLADAENDSAAITSASSEMSGSLCSFSSLETQDAGKEVVITNCSRCHVGDSIFTGPILFCDRSKQQALSSEEKQDVRVSLSLKSLFSRWQWRRGLGAGLMLFALLLGIIAYFTLNGTEVDESLPEPWLVIREMWGARQPWSQDGYRNGSYPFSLVIIIHTGGRECRSLEDCSKIVYRMQRFHQMDLHWDDIAYNFLIGGDGRVYEGRGFNYTGVHTSTCNSFCLGLAYIGDYRSLYGNAVPSAMQIKSMFHLIETAVKEGWLNPGYFIVPHCHAIQQESPGDNIYCTMHSWPNFRDDNLTISSNGPTLSATCPHTCGSSSQDTAFGTILMTTILLLKEWR